MGYLHGEIIDSHTGKSVAAKVQVLTSSGEYASPHDAIHKVGTGAPFFYSDGSFSVEIPRGHTRVTIERGTEYEPKIVTIQGTSGGTNNLEVEISRWNKFSDQGWHAGNTHIHYDEKETRSDQRLSLDPRVEDLRMTAVSILKRGDLEYATNKYPVGILTDFSSSHHYVQNGEESRHNKKPWEIGYGHVMLLDIRNAIDPLSRGVLVSPFDPDYPPLSYACDETRTQGGTVIWCHNGQGMEAPVAAALGKVDAFNLFDPYWSDAEYDIYYQMLNSGIRLPVSTGSDWYICSANRVYAQTTSKFEYLSWLNSLKTGKTFITNGPFISFKLDNHSLGAEVHASPGDMMSLDVEWKSYYPVKVVEIIQNGRVVVVKNYPISTREGSIKEDIKVSSDGWFAARLFSGIRDSYLQPLFAHTSPIYVTTGKSSPEQKKASRKFVEAIDNSIEWVQSKGRFYNDAQRAEVEDLFREGQEQYRKWAKQ